MTRAVRVGLELDVQVDVRQPRPLVMKRLRKAVRDFMGRKGKAVRVFTVRDACDACAVDEAAGLTRPRRRGKV